MDVPSMFAYFGRLLDESGRAAYGATEIEAVENLAVENRIRLWNEE
jgi:hypothetical protein